MNYSAAREELLKTIDQARKLGLRSSDKTSDPAPDGPVWLLVSAAKLDLVALKSEGIVRPH